VDDVEDDEVCGLFWLLSLLPTVTPSSMMGGVEELVCALMLPVFKAGVRPDIFVALSIME
jgi:hypothetical protein